ncbi:PPE family protein, SVP subgroup [Streptomyces sp. 4N124]|uniref:PPE family protein, SVP subgroup n=1 Tax=Streptomyces sp. 4N124 TaxID=3457420 RepID=UPI003FD13F4C
MLGGEFGHASHVGGLSVPDAWGHRRSPSTVSALQAARRSSTVPVPSRTRRA